MEIPLLLLLIVLNGVFAMSELALVAARPAQLAGDAAAGDPRAAAALALKQDPTRFLSTVQIGITSISILNGIVGEAAFAGPLSELMQSVGIDAATAGIASTIFVVVLITYVSIVVGELVPKRIAQVSPARIARAVALPMNVLARAAGPFVWLLSVSTEGLLRLLRIRDKAGPPITEEEIHAMLAEGSAAGIIEPGEHAMLRSVFDLDDYRVSTWMTPRGELTMLDANASIADSLPRILLSHEPGFAVYEDAYDNVVGIVHTTDLTRRVLSQSTATVSTCMRPALFVPETLTGRELMDTFRNAREDSALVVDEYGDLQGMITLNDLMTAITGAVDNDPDDSPAVQRDDGSWSLDGRLPTARLRELLLLSALPGDESDDFDTLAGMMMTLLGRVGQVGDHHDWEQWRFEIVDVDRRRIDRVLVSRLPAASMDPEADTG